MIIQTALLAAALFCAYNNNCDRATATFAFLGMANLCHYLVFDYFSLKGPRLKFPLRKETEKFRIVIIGSGMSGILMGVRLKSLGFHDFVIIDKASDFGGTWLSNRYPGVGCDIASHVYSYSFYQNPWWSKIFAQGPEIHKYLLNTVKHFQLRKYAKFGVTVTKMEWEEKKKGWDIHMDDGQTLHANVVVNGTGALHIPLIPKFKNSEAFKKNRYLFHSSDWPKEGLDLKGKRVAVIGAGATAVQLIPEMAKVAERVICFQRSGSWVPRKYSHIYFLKFYLISLFCSFFFCLSFLGLNSTIRIWSSLRSGCFRSS